MLRDGLLPSTEALRISGQYDLLESFVGLSLLSSNGNSAELGRMLDDTNTLLRTLQADGITGIDVTLNTSRPNEEGRRDRFTENIRHVTADTAGLSNDTTGVFLTYGNPQESEKIPLASIATIRLTTTSGPRFTGVNSPRPNFGI